MNILTLDLGSSSVRAMLFDGAGRSFPDVRGQRAYEMRTTPGGGAEVDADVLLDLVERTIDEAMDEAGPRASAVAGVGISSFWHSLLGTDEAGRAVTPVYSWADTRAASHALALQRELDAPRVHARTGAVLHSSYWPAKLRWLASEHPDLFQAARRWMSFGEYLFLRLFGEANCSISMASGTGLFDQRGCQWDAEMLAVVAITANQLPPVDDSPSTGLTRAYARRWPALGSIPWFPALGDGACGNVGCGAVDANRIGLTVGTSGAMRVVAGADYVEPPEGLWTYRLDAKRYVVGGALSEGGGLIAWLRDLLRLDDDERIAAEVEAMDVDTHGLTMLPFVAGERSTGWAPDARAAIAGMTLDTKPVDILRAALESVACRFTLIADRLPSFVPRDAEVVAAGGALASAPFWARMIADALGRPVSLSTEAEASSRGAALKALEALGHIDSLAAIPAGTGVRFEPDARRHERFLRAVERQKMLYEVIVGG